MLITTSLLEIQFPPHLQTSCITLSFTRTLTSAAWNWHYKYAFTELCSPCQNVFSDLGFPYGKQMVLLVIEDTVICCACCLYSLGKNCFSGFTLECGYCNYCQNNPTQTQLFFHLCELLYNTRISASILHYSTL